MPVSLGDETSLPVEIVEQVAAHEDKEFTDLPPLHRTIDIDAVKRLSQEDSVSIEFTYIGYQISITDGDVAVEPQ